MRTLSFGSFDFVIVKKQYLLKMRGLIGGLLEMLAQFEGSDPPVTKPDQVFMTFMNIMIVFRIPNQSY